MIGIEFDCGRNRRPSLPCPLFLRLNTRTFRRREVPGREELRCDLKTMRRNLTRVCSIYWHLPPSLSPPYKVSRNRNMKYWAIALLFITSSAYDWLPYFLSDRSQRFLQNLCRLIHHRVVVNDGSLHLETRHRIR